MGDSVSCIIPAYNEGPRVGKVLKIALSSKEIDQVVTINDGSSDETLGEMKKFSRNKKLKIINLVKNSGKSMAFAKGFDSARGDIILMLDSDLNGLTVKHVKMLVDPILENRAEMTMSLRDNSAWFYKLLGIDFVSGERAFRKKLINDTNEVRRLKSYGIEVFINKKFVAQKGRLKVVKLNGLSITRKSEKIGFFKGTIGEMSMIKQLVQSQGFFGMVFQALKLRNLKVKD